MYCQFQSIFSSRSAAVFDLLIFFNPIKFKGHKNAILTFLLFIGQFIKQSHKTRYSAILTHYSVLHTSYSKAARAGLLFGCPARVFLFSHHIKMPPIPLGYLDRHIIAKLL